MRIATTGTLNTGDTFLVFHGPYKEIIPRMAAAGYDAVEMHIFDSAAIDRKELWDTLKENGMTSAQVADLMGHADTRMVETVYARAREEGIKKRRGDLEKMNKQYAVLA